MLFNCTNSGHPAAPLPVILDTDIGDDIDDAFGLIMALRSPELDILGICVNTGEVELRANLVCRLLELAGRTDIPVLMGESGPPQEGIAPQLTWVENYNPPFPPKTGAPEFIIKLISANPGVITVLAYGPLSNIRAAFLRNPEIAPLIKDLMIMGGAVHIGYNNAPPPVPEYNIKHDTPASQVVFSSGVRLTMLGLDVTTMMQPSVEQMVSLVQAKDPLLDALMLLYFRWTNALGQPIDALPDNAIDLIRAHYGEKDKMRKPTLYDLVAILTAFDDSDIDFETLPLIVDYRGMTVIDKEKGKPVRAGIKVDKDTVLRKMFERLVKIQKAKK